MTTGSASLQPTVRRQVAAVLTGAVVGTMGALILGEYDFSGSTPYVAGLLFGLVIAEVILTVARIGRPVLALAASVISGIGVLWAAWISSGRGVAPIPGAGYVAMVIAIAVAGGWVSIPSRRHRRQPQ